MIGLDANVLVRYLVQDEPTQSTQANAFIARNPYEYWAAGQWLRR